MNIKKKVIAAALIFSVLPNVALAYDATYKITTDGTNVSVTEDTLTGTTDFSGINVDVYKITNNEKEVIYNGLLRDYDNGAWSNLDFDGIDFLVIFNWDNDDVIYVVPNDNTENTTNTASIQNTQNLLQTTSSLSLASQIKINGVNVGENGMRIIDNANLSCNFTLANNGETTQKLSVMLATYTDTRALYNVKMTEISVESGKTGNAQIAYKFNADKEHSGKLMFWDSLSGMMPIRTSIDFTQNSGVNAYYYNSDNRLLQIDKANNTSIYFTYDKMGNLLRKTISGGESQ